MRYNHITVRVLTTKIVLIVMRENNTSMGHNISVLCSR